MSRHLTFIPSSLGDQTLLWVTNSDSMDEKTYCYTYMLLFTTLEKLFFHIQIKYECTIYSMAKGNPCPRHGFGTYLFKYFATSSL
jgi:hypothetical protein